MKLIIEDDEGRKTVVPFVREEITIGRQEGNTIRLTERNVSRRHARLYRQNGHVVVEDLGSYNGIRVNGEKIGGPSQVHDGDLIQIGDYDLAIQTEAQAHPSDDSPTEVNARIDLAELDAVASAESAPPSPGVRHEETAIIRVDQIEANKPRPVVAIDPDEAPRLVVLNTELAGREFSCIRSELKVGRTEENDISLDHRSLSRTHAKLVREENGEWKIFDLRSANGLTVNGESYSKATLSHGDVIELGHLKLRFVGAGQSYTFVAGDEAPLSKKKLPFPLVAGVAAGVLVLGVVAVWALGGARPAGGDAQPEASRPSTAAPASPVAEVTAAPVEPAPAAPAPEPEPEPEPEPAVAPDYSKRLAQAQSAMNARKFEAALPILGALEGPDGKPVAEAQALLDEATAEIAARKAIAQAQKDLAGGRHDDAAALLDQAEGTVAFADDLARVRARLDSAVAAKGAAAARASAPRPQKPAAARPAAAASGTNGARQQLEDGTVLFKKRQFREAKAFFQKCLELDPKFARCHMMLGSTFAKLKDVEAGAKHYRTFVNLAPEDPDAQKVKKFLDEYEASRSN